MICTAYDVLSSQMNTGLAGYPGTVYIPQLPAESEAIIAIAAQQAHAAGVERVSTHISEGNPVDAITTLAKESHADLIVMGTHGRGGVERLLLGSTTEGVTRRSLVPVMVVRCPIAKTTAQTIERGARVDSGYAMAAALP